MKKRQRTVSCEMKQLKDVLTYYWRVGLAAGSKFRDAAESLPSEPITAPRRKWSRLH